MSLGFKTNTIFVPLVDNTPTIWLKNIGICLLGSVLIALSAQISIHLPFTPVPITGQTFAVLLIGVLLGSKKGLMTVLLYLTEGAMGMPVFAGGSGGIHVLLGPSGGYLIGFLPAAFLMGYIVEKGWTRGFTTMFICLIASNSVIYIFGLTHLCLFTTIEKALYTGFYPFLIGDLIKVLILSTSASVMSRLKMTK